MSAALLPEPTYYLASNGRLFQADGDVDCTGKQLTIYTEAQLRAYGAAEYKRGIEDAAQACTAIALAPSNCILGVAVTCATAIRKLGEQA